MTRAFVAAIEVDRMPGEQPSHERSKAGFAGPEKKVKVIGHQCPGETFGAALDKKLGKVPEETPPIGIVAEDVATIHAAYDYMLQKVWNIEARGSWHAGRVAADR
jgi:hypothetical protein